MIKKVSIFFSDRRLKASDCRADILNACHKASLNLEMRHNVKILNVSFFWDAFFLSLDIPDAAAETFSIGNHLRGISSYLIKNCEFDYGSYRVGNRLLEYVDLGEFDYLQFQNIIPVPDN